MVCGEGVTRDSETSNISIFNIIERITTEGFPAFFPKIQVVNFHERQKNDPEKYQADLKVMINRKKLFEQHVKIDFGKKLRHRLIATIGGLAIPEPGILKFFLQIGKKNMGKYEIEVVQAGKTKVKTKKA